MQERRVFTRIDAPLKIRYEVIEAAPAINVAKSKDLSGTGLKLALEEKLDVNTNLRLYIEIPDEKGQNTVAYGKVVWTRRVEIAAGSKSRNYHETGIEFTKVDPLTIGKIFKHFKEKYE
jgi:c-di-GMP-binding flagellar brake protein YcgR